MSPAGRAAGARAALRALLRAPTAALFVAALFLMSPTSASSADERPLLVGSKRFTESYILGEIVTRAALAAAPAVHKPGLGNTAVVVQALQAGAIDVYPEYLGTINAEVLHNASPVSLDAMRPQLAAIGLGVGVPLGFSNGYALAMSRAQADSLGVHSMSDLAKHPELKIGLSHEFLGRADGWPGLARAYALGQQPIGIDHGVAYEALASGRIAATDIYSTDAKIAELGLVVLDDDRHYFPRYDAVLLYRADTPSRLPAAWKAVEGLQGRIDQARMVRMNGDAELRQQSFTQIATAFLSAGAASGAGGAATGRNAGGASGSASGAGLAASGAVPSSGAGAVAPLPGRQGFLSRLFGDDLGRLTREHLFLVIVAIAVASVIGVPLGALAAAVPRLEQTVMAVVGVLQTIPSLALLAMLIPLLGRIGTVPALVALAAYALLPIVRNTTTGLAAVPEGIRQAGTALGLTPAQRWRSIDLPLAMPVIVAGLKTAAVITVGTATIAAFIGAGGYGERIATGLALNDHDALLAGAIPAAAMALVTQGLFEIIERLLLRGRPR